LKVRVPIEEEIVILTVICVVLFTVVLFIVIPDDPMTELTPFIKFVPVRVTFTVVPWVPLVGEMPVKVGAGLLTVKVFVAEVPPPGVPLVTEKLLLPVAAVAPMVMLATICVELFTVVLFTVIPVPTFTELTPLIKLVPVKVTLSVCRRLPVVGEILVRVGAGLL
jgi:hypothetical protein